MAAPPSYTKASIPAPVYTTTPFTAGGSDALPGYNDSNAPSSIFVSSQGIDEKLPNHFKINNQYVTPQLLPSELQAHLVLLGAFYRLREEVRTFKGKADIAMEPDDRWAVYLQRAVYRFEQWAVRMIGGEGQEEALGEGPRVSAPNEVPPLDVLMVWHTYMLNPRTYYEDCLRKLPGLLRIGSLPLMQLAGSIDSETLLSHPPSESRVAAFAAFTGQPFDCPLNTTSEETVHVYCPSCSESNAIPWITYKGDGFAQRGFGCSCNNCQFMFTRETLGVRKFYEDMEKCAANPDRFYLANTVVDYHAGVPADAQASHTLTVTVLSLQEGRPTLPPPELGKQLGWTMKSVEDFCRVGMLGKKNQTWVTTPRPLNIILSAYRQPGPFSLDLASAVLRQMNFVEKMVNLGFTEQARWEEDHDSLTRCVFRRWILTSLGTLISCSVIPSKSRFTNRNSSELTEPSLDSSLHSRKLTDLIGIVPDHDDKVNQGALSDAYDRTAEAWKTRFGVPYSLCGCLPPDNSSGSSGSSFSLFSKKGKSKSTLEKLIENARTDLLSPSDEAAEQTHPSDHHAVAIINPGEPNAASAQLRRRELAKRAKELRKSVEKGKSDQWGEVMHKRAVDHSPSFLCPVQYGAQSPFSKFGQGDCTTFSGNGIINASAAGECCKGNGINGLCGAQFDQPRGGPEESVKYSMIMRGGPSYAEDVAVGIAQHDATWL
ncbi:hypothetical protein FRC01_009006 [Tulasnella sp. 417]|nr:hypothetical protein FRC01_009006 [Tulasnella sp. 417]